MRTIKCPNCGKKINAFSRVCPYCHCDLKTADRTDFHPNHHWMHKLTVGTVGLIVIACIGGGGFYGYHYIFAPHKVPVATHYKTSSEESSSEPSISHAKINTNLNSICKCVDSIANQLNQGSADDGGLSDYYYNGQDNKYYSQLHDWAMHQRDVTLTTDARVISIDRTSANKAKIKYRIHYIFNHDHQDHIQEFDWYAHLKYTDGSWKIVKDHADNTPIVNKTESSD